MQLLSAERFELAKPYLRRTIPRLFDELEPRDRPLYETKFVHANSMLGAIAVQRLAGGVIHPVHLTYPEMPPEAPTRRHAVNLVHGQVFDVFGFMQAADNDSLHNRIVDDTLSDVNGLVLLVENVLDEVRIQLSLPVEVLK